MRKIATFFIVEILAELDRMPRQLNLFLKELGFE